MPPMSNDMASSCAVTPNDLEGQMERQSLVSQRWEGLTAWQMFNRSFSISRSVSRSTKSSPLIRVVSGVHKSHVIPQRSSKRDNANQYIYIYLFHEQGMDDRCGDGYGCVGSSGFHFGFHQTAMTPMGPRTFTSRRPPSDVRPTGHEQSTKVSTCPVSERAHGHDGVRYVPSGERCGGTEASLGFSSRRAGAGSTCVC